MSKDEWGIDHKEEPTLEAYKPPKGRSMWDVMNSSIDKKIKPTTEEKRKINEFMFHKLLARFEGTLEFALMFTSRNIPVEFQYDIIDSYVPKGFIPFEKRSKNSDDATITNIMEYYRCSERIAEEYEAMMPEYEKERINNKYNKGKM